MHHPYQCLATCRPGEDSSAYLLAASGHKLFSVNLDDGTIASQWPKESENDSKVTTTAPTAQTQGPPTKKRRLSTIQRGEVPPNIILLSITPSHQYAVIVTAEDKCLRVFSISNSGELVQLSARNMPKRPCALAFTPDERTILSADKFGDVYSLPLLIDDEYEAQWLAEQKSRLEEKEKDYAPAATELTVHSRANRRALEAQLQQAKEKLVTKSKDLPSFSYKLELGHVSMLTDMLVTSLQPSDDEDAKKRTFIITSDRDEHIRVSRGPPQAHVIETYCLGHHDFVSSLCLVEEDLLVSGGGDDEIFVWDWLEGKCVNRIDLVEVVKRARLHIRIRAIGDSATVTEAEMTEAEAVVEKITREGRTAVKGLWLFEDSSMKTEPQLLIAVEGIPALLHIPVARLREEKASEDMSFLCLDGNVLDVATIGDALIVSTDNIHQPGSTTEVDSRDSYKPRVLAFQAMGEELGGGAVFKAYSEVNNALTELNERYTADWHEKALQNLLYSTETLRKRPGKEDEGSAIAEEA